MPRAKKSAPKKSKPRKKKKASKVHYIRVSKVVMEKLLEDIIDLSDAIRLTTKDTLDQFCELEARVQDANDIALDILEHD